MPTIDATISQLMLLGLFTCILFAMRQTGAIAALAPFLKETPDVRVLLVRALRLARRVANAPFALAQRKTVTEIAEDVHFFVFIGLMIYLITITIVIVLSLRLVKNWARNESTSLLRFFFWFCFAIFKDESSAQAKDLFESQQTIVACGKARVPEAHCACSIHSF